MLNEEKINNSVLIKRFYTDVTINATANQENNGYVHDLVQMKKN